MLRLTQDGGAVLLSVKVVPGASRTRILGEWDGRARIAVAAAPEKGKANQALVDFVAEILGISRRQVAIVAGQRRALKDIRIEGVGLEAVAAALKPSRA